MGRLIDVDEVKKRYPIMENDFGMVVNDTLHKELDKIPTVEAIPKADYEARLKADMVAMLEELYMEIEELDTPSDFDSYDAGIVDCEGLIQEKINALKAESEVEDDKG